MYIEHSQTGEKRAITECFFGRNTMYNNSWCVIDVIHPFTGRALYSGETLEQISERYAEVSRMSLDDASERQNAQYVSGPVEISEEAYQDALNCLPPVAWTRAAGWESFKMSERTCGDVTAIYVCKLDPHGNHSYYTLSDSIRTPHDECVARVAALIETLTA